MKNHLAMAVATFVLLDLGTLGFSYTIARQVEKDAVAINLAGRQRMLSQRITKAALLAVKPDRTAAQRAESVAELHQADQTFRRTLTAFANGGETIGGDGRPVELESVQGKAALLVGEVRGVMDQWTIVPKGDAELTRFSHFMNERNGDILDAMNQFTTELEQESVASVSRLRIAQTLAFILSLLNFLFILHGMHRARFAAETASITDTLTGLLNRGGVYRELNSAIEICREDNIPLGVLMLDLDGFKAVNDNFGHAAGDASLREVARRLQGFCHLDWVCGRLGGDEFAVICPGVTEEFIADAAQQLTSILGGIPGGGLTISASVGWTSVKPGQTADAVIAMADAKMYSVKSDGRTAKNRRNNAR